MSRNRCVPPALNTSASAVERRAAKAGNTAACANGISYTARLIRNRLPKRIWSGKGTPPFFLASGNDAACGEDTRNASRPCFRGIFLSISTIPTKTGNQSGRPSVWRIWLILAGPRPKYRPTWYGPYRTKPKKTEFVPCHLQNCGVEPGSGFWMVFCRATKASSTLRLAVSACRYCWRSRGELSQYGFLRTASKSQIKSRRIAFVCAIST